MRKITKEELEEILKKHKMWLNDEKGGERADLTEADLTKVDLTRTDLFKADLTGADLTGADLTGADLREANLIDADLRRANLEGANLRGAYLIRANLIRADLRWANLRGADLIEADLRWANLTGSDLTRTKLISAYLHDTILNNTKINFPMVCPEKGSFIGYKKAQNQIIELLIPEDAQRSSATTRKCRCDKAKVLSITNLDGTAYLGNEVQSNYNSDFIYKIGDIVSVDDFDLNRWNECSTGIHFFITREEAVAH